MDQIIEITITPEEIQDLNLIHHKACLQANVSPKDWVEFNMSLRASDIMQ
jgi:hypothetical protein